MLAPSFAYQHHGRLSVPRTNGIAVGVRDVALFAGGYTDSAGKNKSAVVDIYNATADSWSVTNMTTGRTLFAGTGIDDLAWFGCGETDSVQSETDSVDVWSASSGQWLPPSFARLSQARKKCSAASVVLERAADGTMLAGVVVFAGGWPLGGHAPTDFVDIFSFRDGAWSARVAKLSVPRMYMSAASVGVYVIFAGGLAEDGDSSVVDVLDAHSLAWRRTALVAPQREGSAVGTTTHAIFYGAGHSQLLQPSPSALTWSVRNHSAQWAKMAAASACGGRVALFAGGVGCPGNDCATVEMFDDASGTWSLSNTSLSVARQYAMGAGFPDPRSQDLAVFAGGLNASHNSTAVVDFVSVPACATAA
jgi:hypothetical protein